MGAFFRSPVLHKIKNFHSFIHPSISIHIHSPISPFIHPLPCWQKLLFPPANAIQQKKKKRSRLSAANSSPCIYPSIHPFNLKPTYKLPFIYSPCIYPSIQIPTDQFCVLVYLFRQLLRVIIILS